MHVESAGDGAKIALVSTRQAVSVHHLGGVVVRKRHGGVVWGLTGFDGMSVGEGGLDFL